MTRLSLHTRSRQGVALLMVILVAALAFVGVVAALSFVNPRTSMVKGESASDRALSVADGMIDRILGQVNQFGLSFTGESATDAESAQDEVVLKILEGINGEPPAGVTDDFAKVLQRTQTYVINAATNDIFLLRHGTASAAGISTTGTFDKVLSLAPLQLQTVSGAGGKGLKGLQDTFPGGDWFVAVTGARYEVVSDQPSVTPDSWTLTCTAWNAQNPTLTRTIQAEASKGNVRNTNANPSDNSNWYVSVLPTSGQPGTLTSFADFVFLADDDIRFAQSSVVTGDVFANGNVYNPGTIMGTTTAGGHGQYYAPRWVDPVVVPDKVVPPSGWVPPVYKRGKLITPGYYKYPGYTIPGYTIPGYWTEGTWQYPGYVYGASTSSGTSIGKFGPNAESLTAAKADGTVKEGQDPANFPNGGKSIDDAAAATKGTIYSITATGSNPATIEFLRDGTLKINGGSPVAMPANGLIYVEGGSVKVKGEVNGRVTVVAGGTVQKDYSGNPVHDSYGNVERTGGDIRIVGNITYVHPLMLTPGETLPTTPDSLGLLAHRNVILDKTYYGTLASRVDKRELEVDAAAMAVTGWIGIDPDAGWHTSSGRYAADPPYTLVWKGARIFASFDNAPENTSGDQTQGFEIKQSNYDFSLQKYKCPPGFPYTRQSNSPPVQGETGRLQQLVEDADKDVLTYLRGVQLTASNIVQVGQNWYMDPNAYYHVSYNGHDYYRANGSTGGSSWTAMYDKTGSPLYRVDWRESIGVPLQPHD